VNDSKENVMKLRDESGRHPRRALPTALPFLLLLALALALLGAGTSLAGREVVEDGVLHVKNGASPSEGVKTLQLVEKWRAGGEDDDENLFGLITEVLLDEGGNIYLLDTQLSEVQVFDRDGANLKTLSREGEGPGEVRNPSDMLFMPDGSLGLVQTFPGKIVKIDLEGNPQGTFEPGGGDPTKGGLPVVIDAECEGGKLYLGGMQISPDPTRGTQTRTHYVASFSDDGTESARYLERKITWDFADMLLSEKNEYFVHFRHWDVGPDGRIYAAPYRNRYAIEVYKPDGTLERVIEREYTSWKRDERALARTQSLMDAQASRFPFEIKREIEDTEPDITSLSVEPDGNLWVLTSRGGREQPPGILCTYDVFTPDGQFLRQVAAACDGDGANDILFFAQNGDAVRVTGFFDAVIALQGGGAAETEEEAAPMEVIYYTAKL
jgi:hypothetical protein